MQMARMERRAEGEPIDEAGGDEAEGEPIDEAEGGDEAEGEAIDEAEGEAIDEAEGESEPIDEAEDKSIKMARMAAHQNDEVASCHRARRRAVVHVDRRPMVQVAGEISFMGDLEREMVEESEAIASRHLRHCSQASPASPPMQSSEPTNLFNNAAERVKFLRRCSQAKQCLRQRKDASPLFRFS